MKLTFSLSQNLSLQQSTSLALEEGFEHIYSVVKAHEEQLTSSRFIREIQSFILKSGKKSYFGNQLPSSHFLSSIPNLLGQAILYAANRHQGEFRDSGTPYIAHVLNTGFFLARLGFPREIVLAGILHDTVEDTNQKNAVLNDLYNLMPEIAFYVYSVSGPDIKDAVEKDRILQMRIQSFSDQAGNIFPQAIKCADGIANLSDLRHMEAKDGRTAADRKLLFLKKSEETLIPYARSIDQAGIIPLKKKKERFFLEEYVSNIIWEKKQEV
jgi:(p)ppGpp synthase/HD superfamily hydrolase